MAAHGNELRAHGAVATTDNHLADFLDMLSSERGASQNTIDAYTGDLEGFFGFLSERTVEAHDARVKDVQAYLAMLTNAGQAPASRSRRLSAIKQYYGSCSPKISSKPIRLRRCSGPSAVHAALLGPCRPDVGSASMKSSASKNL